MAASGAHEAFEKKYILRTPNSRKFYETACQHLPGGVAASGGYRQPYPLYIKEARGSKIWDIDGNEYIDLMVGAGSPILGHSAPPVVEAVREQLSRGTNTVVSYQVTAELAQKIKQHLPGMDLVRFVNTGSEAVHMALRVARAYTGRQKHARFEGIYHGQMDDELVSGNVFGGKETAPEPVPMGAGIPRGVLDDIVVLPWNNLEAAVAIIKRHAHELAAVLIEPVGCALMGALPLEKSFVQTLRKLCDEEGIVFIWDEVVTGFRVSLNGAYPLYEVVPDLRVLGKAVGGGFPIGIYGGRRDIMDKVVTPGEGTKIFQSGTYSGNPLTMAAGLATVKELEKPGFYKHINGLGERIRDGLRKISAELGIHTQVTGIGPMFNIYFGEHPIRSIRDIAASDKQAAVTFNLGLLANGVHCPSFHVMFLCGAHTTAEADQILKVSREVLGEMKKYQR